MSSEKVSNQSAQSTNTGPNIVYTGAKHRLHKDGTPMENSPSTPNVAFAAHNHGHKDNG
jgi:hypothetical protein